MMKVNLLNGVRYPFRTGWYAESYDHARFFMLKVTADDFVSAGICPGDTVVVMRQDIVDQNDIAVVRVSGGNPTLQHLHRVENFCILDSPDGPAQIYDAAEVQVLGKVVERRRKY